MPERASDQQLPGSPPAPVGLTPIALLALPIAYVGNLLAGLFAVVGLVAAIRWRVLRTRR